ncbi:GNAT family N-acetyltransferase, partial [Pseudomonas sp. BEA3.1]
MLPLALLPTTIDQAPLIRNLYQFYCYESSDWEQEDVEADGRFYIHEEHLHRYWQDDGWGAYLVLVDGFIAGFVLVERSELPGIDAHELADLFILKKYRRQGIGRAVALQL